MKDLISVNEFCVSHNLELSFINSLHESGLIEISTLEEKLFIPTGELPTLEKFVRLRFDLEINLEGIECINHLLKRIESLQEENRILKNRLEVSGEW